jgi:hypothetical protein
MDSELNCRLPIAKTRSAALTRDRIQDRLKLGLRTVLCVAILSVSPSARSLAQSESSEKSIESAPRVSVCNGWLVAETSRFWVCCYNRDLPAARIAQDCEALQERLSEKWLAQKEPASWSAKCMVVLHPNRESYLAAVGAEAGSTCGSSEVERVNGSISKRRIDLRGDRSDYLTAALPHEMTHVVLADHFSGQSLPRWADEGMAILADTETKRGLHSRDLRAAFLQNKAFRITELMPLQEYPSAERWGVFYGQSMSVVDYLVRRGSPHRFVQFLDAAKAGGYDAALQDCYGIHGMRELDQLWMASVSEPLAAEFRLAGTANPKPEHLP